jgi:hypothetical protein
MKSLKQILTEAEANGSTTINKQEIELLRKAVDLDWKEHEPAAAQIYDQIVHGDSFDMKDIFSNAAAKSADLATLINEPLEGIFMRNTPIKSNFSSQELAVLKNIYAKYQKVDGERTA